MLRIRKKNEATRASNWLDKREVRKRGCFDESRLRMHMARVSGLKHLIAYVLILSQLTSSMAATFQRTASLFPSPQAWGEGARRADEGLCSRSSSVDVCPKGLDYSEGLSFEAPQNPNASYLVPTTYRPFQSPSLPNVGFMTPFLRWAQSGHLDSLSLTSEQLGIKGPLRGGVTWSSLTGTFYNAQYLFSLNERLAVNMLGEYGHGQHRLNGTLGFGISPLVQVKLTAERLSQRLPFSFDSGDITSRLHQDALGVRFQQQFNHPFFQNINGGGYYARAQNKDLAPVLFTSNGANCAGYAAGLSCINYRHIAGAFSSGFDWGAELLLTPSTLLGGNVYYDQVVYDTRLTGDGSHDSDGLGGSVKVKHLLSNRLQFSGEASVRKIYDSFQGSINWLPPFRDMVMELSLTGEHVVSHNATANNDSVSVQARWLPEGSQGYETRFQWQDKPLGKVAEWVKTPAVYMKQVLAIAEQITRLLAPTIVELIPNSGPFEGGNEVTITGSNFVSGLAVFFGGQLATTITVLSSTTLTAIVPPALSMTDSPVVDVVVQNPDGQQTVLPQAYTYGEGASSPTPFLWASPPDDALQDVGQTATFTSEGSGGIEPYRYQWQISTDYGYNFVNLPGETNPVYTTPSLTSEYNGYRYRLALLDAEDMGVVSEPAILMVDKALITSKPADTTAILGQTVRFDTVTDLGTLPYRYQWQVNRPESTQDNRLRGAAGFTNIPEATESSYITPPLTPEDHLVQYRVVVSDDVGAILVSDVATLTVLSELALPPLPTLVEENEGRQAVLSSKAQGGSEPYAYQWQVKRLGEEDFSPVQDGEGATTPTYTTVPLQQGEPSDDGNQYRLVVTDARGTVVTGEPTTLLVHAKPSLFEQPQSMEQNVRQMATFRVTVKDGTMPYTYRWQWSPDDGDFSSYRDVEDAMDSSSSYTTPELDIEDHGKHYRVIVTDARGDTVMSQPALLSVHHQLTSRRPADALQVAGEVATFTTEASGGVGNYAYQWQVSLDNGQTFSEVTQGSGQNEKTYTTEALLLTDSGRQYRVAVTDGSGDFVSEAALLTVTAALFIDEPPQGLTRDAGQTATFVVRARGGSEPYAYQWQSRLGTAFFADVSQTTAARFTTPELMSDEDGKEFLVIVTDKRGASATSQSATLRVNPKLWATSLQDVARNVGQQAVLETKAHDGTPPYAYQWQQWDTTSNQFVDVPDGDGGTRERYTTETLSLEKDHGKRYRVIVTDDVDNSVTCGPATLTVHDSLKITEQPKIGEFNVNQQASFQVKAEQGTPPYRYFWQVRPKGDNPYQAVSDAKNAPSYTTPLLTNAQRNEVKEYRVLVMDSTDESLPSEPATLTVHEQLTVKPPESVARNAEQTATFNTEAHGGSRQYTYQWQVKRQTDDGFHDVSGGSGSNEASYTTAPLQLTPDDDDASDYLVIVTDSMTQQQVFSEPAHLTVNEPLSIEINPTDYEVNAGHKTSFFAWATSGTGDYHYQWQTQRGNEEFANLSDTDNFIYTTPELTLEYDNQAYRVVVTDDTLQPKISDQETLTVHASLTTSKPEDRVQDISQKASFTTHPAGGTGAYHFQWQVKKKEDVQFTDVTDGEGKTSQIYTTGALQNTDDGNQYQVIVTDALDDRVMSGAATLLVGKNELLITEEPQGTTSSAGQQAVFNVAVIGGTEPYDYQWQSRKGADDFTLIPDASRQSSSYTTPKLSSDDNTRQYRVVVTDKAGLFKTSKPATLTVDSNPNQLTTEAPVNASHDVGQTASFSTVPSGGASPYTYQWQKKSLGGGFTNITENGIKQKYVTPELQSSDNRAQFRVEVTDNNHQHIISNAAILQVRDVLNAETPDSKTQNVGQTVTFSTRPSGGTPDYHYQWQKGKNGTFENINSADAKAISFTIPKIDKKDAGDYRVVVTDATGGEKESGSATLTVHNKLMITQLPPQMARNVNQTATFSTKASQGTGTPSYQWYKKGPNDLQFNKISEADSYTTLKLTKADNPSLYRVTVTDEVGDRAESEAVLLVNDELTTTELRDQIKNEGQTALFGTETTNGTTNYTYRWQVKSRDEVNFVDILDAGNDSYSTGTLNKASDDGKTFKVIVTDAGGGYLERTATLTVNDKLTAKAIQPGKTVTRNAGQEVTLSSGGEKGTLDYTYQWEVSPDNKKFTPIKGAQEASYPIKLLGSQHSGYYRLTVTDKASDRATSEVAQLTVHEALQVTGPGPGEVVKNEGQTLTLKTKAEKGTPNQTAPYYHYVWQSSADGNVFTNIPNANDSESVEIGPLKQSDPKGPYYRVAVSDAVEEKAGEAIKLTVNQLLKVTGLPDSVEKNVTQTMTLTATPQGGAGAGHFSYAWYKAERDKDFDRQPVTGETTNTYTMKNLKIDQNQTRYQVRVTDNKTQETKESVAIPLTVYDLQVKRKSEAMITRNEKQTVTLEAEAGGGSGNYEYTWQDSDDNNKFQDISGVPRTAKYLLTSLDTSQAKFYRLKVKDKKTEFEKASDAIQLVVNGELKLVPPKDLKRDENTEAKFSVQVDKGTAPYTYQWQWQKDNGAFNNLTTNVSSTNNQSTYTISSVSKEDHGKKYRVIARDKAGASVGEGAIAKLEVYDVLTLADLNNQTKNVGQKASFTAEPKGGTGTYTYQWQGSMDNWANTINLVTSKTYDIPELKDIEKDRSYQYKVIVTDEGAGKAEKTVTLKINDKLNVTINADNTSVKTGGQVIFTPEVSKGTPSYTKYQWQKKKNDNNAPWENMSTTNGKYTTDKLNKKEDNQNQYRLMVTDTAQDTQFSTGITVTVNAPDPSIKELKPAEGNIVGGEKITINGDNFDTGGTIPTVKFGDVTVHPDYVSVSSAQQIIVTKTPKHEWDTVKVVVINPDKSQSNLMAFSYKAELPDEGARYQGGIVACRLGSLPFSLIAATVDNNASIEWGGEGQTIGVNEAVHGDANTKTIVAKLGGGTYAAQLCNEYQIDSDGKSPCQTDPCYKGWFLPAESQLVCLYNRLKNAGKSVFFNSGYWSSTEKYDDSAVYVNFADQGITVGAKHIGHRVRCVRYPSP